MLSLTVTTSQGEAVLEFEHSLLSLSKWEAKTRKAFLGSAQKTPEEMIDYFRLMLTSPEQDADLVYALNAKQYEELTDYINSTPGATLLPPKDEDIPRHSGEQRTAEIIYMQMTMLRIPWEAQTWHLNRLLTLIAWTAYKQAPPKKERRGNLLQKWSDINERNKQFFKSNG